MARGQLTNAMKAALRGVFRIVPFGMALKLAALNRHLYNQLPPGHTLVFDRYHGSLRVNIDTVYPIERQMLSGEYDPETARVIRRFLGAGQCGIDVGANAGAHTLLMAKQVGSDGQVLAFEPGPPIFARLTGNLQLNPQLGLTVVPEMLGLSDEPGELMWNELEGNRGNAHLRSAEGTAVPVTTLDTYLAEHPTKHPVSFMKIDVEGMELQVLRGAEALLRRDHPILYFETTPGPRARYRARHGADLFEDIAGFLRSAGYHTYRMNRNGALEQIGPDSFPANTLAVPTGGVTERAATSTIREGSHG